jgi:transcriptional regulator with XRE-family HTH domain
MPRWRALPEELDPQVKEFASQLRRLVDRSGLSIASVADRTGYSKTSWERYLNGRLLAPKGAIVALAEVTGTNPIHLTTMWELAERAWSRSEMRHDMTMEAIRISQARAALGEFGGEVGAPPANAKGSGTARKSGSATVTPGIAGPAGVVPSVPPQPAAPDVRDSAGGVRQVLPSGGTTSGSSGGSTTGSPGDSTAGSSGSSPGGSSGRNSWGLVGYQGPSQTAGGRTAGASPPGPTPSPSMSASPSASASADAPGRTAAPSSPYGEPPQGPRPGGDPSGGAGGKRRLMMFLAGVVGVVAVVAAAFFLTDGGDDGKKKAATSTSPSVSTDPDLPTGVKCSGDSCTGKDAESMGCSGDLVTTAKTATVGTTVVEVRYSETCGAAWGRITQAAQGDEVRVTVGKAEQSGNITVAGDTIAYTPMVAVKDAGDAKACVALAAGQEGCTQ